MNEIEKREYKIKQYKNFNKTVIILGFSMVILPLVTYLIRLAFPNMIRCIYYEITLKPCPFCGFTTDMRNILKGNFFAYKYNLLSIPFLFGAILEIIFRIRILKKNNNNNIKFDNLIKVDIIIHLSLFLLLLIYIMLFFLFDLRRF